MLRGKSCTPQSLTCTRSKGWRRDNVGKREKISGFSCPNWYHESNTIFSYFSTAWVCRRVRNAWCPPTKLWAKVTAATGVELMPVDTMITAIPSLSKPTAINSLFEMPDSFHHETSAAKTWHSSILGAKVSLIKSFESDTWRETRGSELHRSGRK